MTKFAQKSFSVPTVRQAKTPCAIHHMVNGKCLRCPVVTKPTSKPQHDLDAQKAGRRPAA